MPNIEHKDLFTKSIGENSEIVTKQMYEFEDKAGRSLVLRPEGTASVVRYHNEFHKDQSNKYSYFGKYKFSWALKRDQILWSSQALRNDLGG